MVQWVVEVVVSLAREDGAGWVHPMWRDVVTAGSTDTALELERSAMRRALDDLAALQPAMHGLLQRWMAGDQCDPTEVWQWLADRVDRALGQ